MSMRDDCVELKKIAEEINQILNDGYDKGYLAGIDIKLIEDLWADIADIASRNRNSEE